MLIFQGYKADKKGNMTFRKTARNFNPDMAMGAKFCIAEVEEILETGELDPDEVHLPGIFVDLVIKGEKYEKRIEKLMLNEGQEGKIVHTPIKRSETRYRIARRAAQEIK